MDLGIDLLPEYEVYLRPNSEMHYLLFKKEIVSVFDPEEKSLVELLDIVLIHDQNQKK